MVFQIGVPKNGWVSIAIKHSNFSIQLDISKVPNDPIAQLSHALIMISDGIKGVFETELNLEPEMYYLTLERIDDKYTFTLRYSKEYHSSKKDIYSTKGNKNEIIMPIYRALMNFYSYNYSEPNWSSQEKEIANKLKTKVKNSP